MADINSFLWKIGVERPPFLTIHAGHGESLSLSFELYRAGEKITGISGYNATFYYKNPSMGEDEWYAKEGSINSNDIITVDLDNNDDPGFDFYKFFIAVKKPSSTELSYRIHGELKYAMTPGFTPGSVTPVGDILDFDAFSEIRNFPFASDETVGGIKVGCNLSIDEDGVLSAVVQAQVNADWDCTTVSDPAYIKNKPSLNFLPLSGGKLSDSLGVGDQTCISGCYSIAIGTCTNATACNTFAQGYHVEANCEYAHAEGVQTIASGTAAHAEGFWTRAYSVGSHAEGMCTCACDRGAHSEGVNSEAIAYGSHAAGHSSRTESGHCYAFAWNGKDTGGYYCSHGKGTFNVNPIDGTEGFYIGECTLSDLLDNAYTLPIASSSVLGGIKVGDGLCICSTTGSLSVLSGCFLPLTGGDLSGSLSIASCAEGSCSFAHGCNTTADGNYSHSEGHCSTSFGEYSHAEGYCAYAHGTSAHAEGHSTTARGGHSHAEGYYSASNGYYSHAEGNCTKSCGVSSHSEGNMTTADGDYSHAEGVQTIACASGSHTDGIYSKTVHELSFAWNGDAENYDADNMYESNGCGTFSINPVGGTDGFYIGTSTLTQLIQAAVADAISNM